MESVDKNTFKTILLNNKVCNEDHIRIFQLIHSFGKHGASATVISKRLGWKHRNDVTNRITALGKNIVRYYKLTQKIKESGESVFWSYFFQGYQKNNYFIYLLKPELAEALKELNLDVFDFRKVQNAFLFAWNPKNFSWDSLNQDKAELEDGKKVIIRWSCSSHKSVRIGDRAFIVRLGAEPKGIIASGFIASEAFEDKHYNDESKDNRHYVQIELDVLINPYLEPILSLDDLAKFDKHDQEWTPRSSGISIKSQLIDELEKTWFEFTYGKQVYIKSETESDLFEGAISIIQQKRYERNPYARSQCLKHYGYSCSVCNFNFEKVYGSLGNEFIHVHHLNQISDQKQEYQINPIEDLRPVCPNCHSMLHRTNPPLSIEELKERFV
ncbi:HNH endonuclease [Leptospira levettii]|uniref:HNH endonuclease n=1 Tax=Leptospira levettii TaxID=2023178 RepID=UPI000C29ED84|nr:HNH endonuclease [Leptospira levettii]PJZ89066.1 hypothetical protein CH368_08555 [Leptospira levettii]